MSKNIRKRIFTVIIITLLITMMIFPTIVNADRTINFESIGKKITKSDAEWLSLTEPTLVEIDEAGNWYIVWAVTDPPKTSSIHYTTTAYRIHTIPASGSGNTADNTDRNKLKNNFKNYGDETKMGNIITIQAGNKMQTKEKVKINNRDYFFRMIKLEPADINYLFGEAGYQPGSKLYFSGIMKNILNKSGTDTRGNIRTYLEWIQGGEHNLVFSSLTRGNVQVSNSGGGTPNENQLRNNIIPNVGEKYIAAVQGHYDREIILDKIEIEKTYNATLEVYKTNLDGTTTQDVTKTLTHTDIYNGTKLIADDNNTKITFYNYANNSNLQTGSPIAEGFEFEKATVNEVDYQKGAEVIVQDTNLVFKFYYKEVPKVVENKINVYKVRKGTGDDYGNSENQLADVITRVGLPGEQQTEVIPKEILSNKDGNRYEYWKVSTYYGNNGNVTSGPHNGKGKEEYTGSYQYTVCDAEGMDTNIVIEYSPIATVIEEPEPQKEPYTDESLNGLARGHILSDKSNNALTGREYNVLDGIPTSESVYSYAEANGYIYKVEGNRIYGTKNYTVAVCTFYLDDDGWVKLDINTSSQPVEQADYEYYTIEKYDIAKLDNAQIQHPILNDGTGDINSWTNEDSLSIDTSNIAESVQYFAHAKIKNDDEELLDQRIYDYNEWNQSIADAINENKAEDEEPIEPYKIDYLNGNPNVFFNNYYNNNETKDDSIIYVIVDQTNSDLYEYDSGSQESISNDAQYAIQTQVSYTNDRILINYNGMQSRIDPAGNIKYLTYDPSGSIDFDAEQGKYENSGDTNFWDKWRGTILGDLAADVFEFFDDAIDKTFGKIIDKYKDRDTLKQRLEGTDILDIAERWDIFIQWWREEKIKEAQAAIDEYNANAAKINGIPRAIPKATFCQENQKIQSTLPNGLYSSPEDSCKVRYLRVEGIGCTPMIEDDTMKQLMNGFTWLENKSSYQINKQCLLPSISPISWEAREGFDAIYLAEEALYATRYVSEGEVNDVIVHTPVAVSAKLEEISGTTEENQFVGTAEDGVEYVKIGSEYKIVLTCKGDHRDILGYGNNNYAMFAKDNKIAIRFPYDIYVNNGSGYKLYSGLQWYDFDVNIGSIKIKIPDWAETEGNANYEIRISAHNDLSMDKEEIGWESVNMDKTNRYEKMYTNAPKDYRAHYKIPVKAVGKIYDFRVNFTSDPEYLLTYTSGKMKDGISGNDADGLSIKNLPVGKLGTNPGNVTYKKAAKLGNKFKFNLKTLGWKTNNIKITPSFYFIPKDGSAPYQVDVYYQDKNTGRYTILNENSTYNLETTLPKTTIQIPNSTQRVTEPGPDNAKITATNKVKDAYSKGELTEFAPSYLSRVTSAKTTSIGNLGKIQLNEEERFRLPKSSNVLKEMASNSIWYGEYKLPSTSKFVRHGKVFNTINPNADDRVLSKPKDGDGYILVCFNIEGWYDDGSNNYRYLSYQKEIEAGKTQWDKEGYDNTNIRLANEVVEYDLPGTSRTHVGVFLYEAFENNNEDVVNPH